MANAVSETIETIKETDIVFDCPFCGKSLAIDYRGAGLTIPCTDCGRDVEVPIPEGMELADFDRSDEEQELRILNLRRSLATAESKVQALEAEVGRLRSHHDTLEGAHRQDEGRVAGIMSKLTAVQKSLQDAVSVLGELIARSPATDETAPGA